MRTLDELGISKTPWTQQTNKYVGAVYDAQGYSIFGLDETKPENARLITAAPRMYKTLCDEYNFLELLYEEMPNEQIEKRMLAIADVLEAASGESEKGEAK